MATGFFPTDMTGVTQVWPQWVQSCGTNTGSTCDNTTTTAWTHWISTTGGINLWNQWVQNGTSGNCIVTVGSLPQQTAEEEAAWRKMVAEQEQKKQNAQKRALELLRQILTETQLAAFEKDQCIPVDAPSGNKYLIKKGRSGNVVSIKDGKPVEKYCIHPSDYEIPDEDCMLAQKLLLEDDEAEFLRIANRTRIAA